MKKHRTAVPDFSSHKPQTRIPGQPVAKPPAGAVTPTPRVKPQSTSAKSGRRGS